LQFLSDSIAQSVETTSIHCVQTYSHIVGLHADKRQSRHLLNNYTFTGWVTGSLYHNVTGIF